MRTRVDHVPAVVENPQFTVIVRNPDFPRIHHNYFLGTEGDDAFVGGDMFDKLETCDSLLCLICRTFDNISQFLTKQNGQFVKFHRQGCKCYENFEFGAVQQSVNHEDLERCCIMSVHFQK